MSRTRLLHILFGLVILVAALHGAATASSLYWWLSWFDTFPHFFGGMFVSLLTVWLWFFSSYLGAHSLPRPRTLFWITVVSALIIGVGWEVFERLVGITWSPEGYWLDTYSDIISDILGGTAMGLYLRSLAIRSSL